MNVSGGLADAIETIRPWVSTSFIGAILALLVKLYLDNRKLRLQAEKRAQEYTLEVSADGRTNLQFIIDNLRADIGRADERANKADTRAGAAELAHAACENELDRVRDEGRRTRDKLDGLARQFVAFADSVASGIPPGNRSPAITGMMQQLADLGRTARDVDNTP